MIFFLISFIAGVLTVLAPCVLPLLPVIIGGSIDGGINRKRAFTIITALGVSLIVFTLALKASTALIDIPQYVWQWISGSIITVFGLVNVFPGLWERLRIVGFLGRGSNRLMATGYREQSFWGDVVVGAALGPVFSACSPTFFVILAAVLPAGLAMGLLDLFAFTLGLTLTLLLVALMGQRLVDRLGIASDPRGLFKRAIGVLFIVVGVAIFTGVEKKAEIWVLDHTFDVTIIEQRLLQLH